MRLANLGRQVSAVRVVAALTMGYSVAITVAPRLLAGPARMTGPDGQVSPEVAALVRSVGVRDAALAAALLVTPAGAATSVLTAARAVSDGADAIWFGSWPAGKATRAKISGVAAGWAALETLAHWADRRR
jgi:hypothetical protein